MKTSGRLQKYSAASARALSCATILLPSLHVQGWSGDGKGKTRKWDLQFLFGFINFAAHTRAIIN